MLADKLFNSKISQLTEIADSPFYAKTVLDFNENSKAKLEFIELSNEIFEKVSIHVKRGLFLFYMSENS